MGCALAFVLQRSTILKRVCFGESLVFRLCLGPSSMSEAAWVRPRCPRLPWSVLDVRGCLGPSSMSEAAWVRPRCPRLPGSVLDVRGCLAPSSMSEAAWVRLIHQSPYFHSNRLEFSTSVCAKTLSDPTGVCVSNFVKIGPETAEEIGDKGEKCPRLPVSVPSLFSNRISHIKHHFSYAYRHRTPFRPKSNSL